MKNIYKIISLAIVAGIMVAGCSEDFLDQSPIGQVNPDVLQDESGANSVLIGAYALLDGHEQAGNFGQRGSSSGTNWIWGDVRSDDMYRGDQTGGWDAVNRIERYELTSTNEWLWRGWTGWYDGVSRTNDVIDILRQAQDISTAESNQIESEARFLRAWYHFNLRIIFERPPYITEDVDPVTVVNDREIWDDIEADLRFGIDNGMEETPSEKGRASRWAAKAFLARVHLFQGEFAEAKPLLDDIINNGPFTLMPHFYDNHSEEFQNNAESIFEIQYSVNDGAGKWNSGIDHQVAYPRILGFCCDYQRPSFDLFNAFKVDENGLPLLETFRDDLDLHDQNVTFDQDYDLPSYPVDPRVDWTLGRRGIPHLDWGVHQGSTWAFRNDEMGPFLNKKIQFWKRNEGTIKSSSRHWAPGINGDNFSLFRLGHAMLWRAEVAVEENDLATAMSLVNQIRERAADDLVMGRVLINNFSGISSNDDIAIDMEQPSANYNLGLYTDFPSQDYARKAVRHEMRLEFALEGMRFFDLVRWGIDNELNDYLQAEGGVRAWMTGAVYNPDEDDYAPIPQNQIDLQGGVLLQNPSNGG